MRLINGKHFEPGPFNLGRFGPYLGSLAVLWVVFITVCTPLNVHWLPAECAGARSGNACGVAGQKHQMCTSLMEPL